ncbi:hypothetical protein FQN54_000330 [Arachnomyces sp. PD_36]|nr:hypothetical protein FQN54_000330 [Arachnomyces sp. PD_36]
MAPSEETILSNFLLAPSPLHMIISLQKFTELFPKRLRSHPQVRVLYRELQQLRAQDIDLVRENLDRQIRKGETQKEELRAARATTGVSGMRESDHREMDIDVQLFGQSSDQASNNRHTLATFLPEMELACASLEKEIEAAESEGASILEELKSKVGELSDLRYGKFNKLSDTANDVASEAVAGLRELEDACNRASMP